MQLSTAYTAAFLSDIASTSSNTPPSSPFDTAPQASAYSRERHGTFDMFLQGPDYARLREQVEGRIQALIDFDGCTAEARRSLRDFRHRLFEHIDPATHRHFSPAQWELMLRETPGCLERLVPLVVDGPMTLASRQTALEGLLDPLQQCAPAVVGALQSAIRQLDPGRKTLNDRFRHAIERTIEQVAVDAVEGDCGAEFSIANLSQRHYVVGLQRLLYAELQLPWTPPEDIFAHEGHPAERVRRCTARLQELLAPGAVARVWAEDYLGRFSEAMRQHSRTHGARILPTNSDIEDATAPLDIEFGPAPPRRALLRESARGVETLRDPTLLALHFLDRLRDAGVVRPEHIGQKIAGWNQELRGRPPLAFELRELDGLAWIEASGQPARGVGASDLRHVPPQALSAAAVLAAIANSSDDGLRKHLKPHWLLCTEIGDRLIGRLGLAAVASHVEQARSGGTWSGTLASWWDDVQDERAGRRAPSGQFAWTSPAGHHALASAQIRELLARRALGESSWPDLQKELGALLIAAVDVDKQSVSVPNARMPRSLETSLPLQLWWSRVGEGLRARPRTVSSQEFVDLLTTTAGDGRSPLLIALSRFHADASHIFLRGLRELQRDGLLDTELLFERLMGTQLAPEGSSKLLEGLWGATHLLDFAVTSAASGHLSRDRCLALFFGKGPAGKVIESLPDVGIRRIFEESDIWTLPDTISALGRAFASGVLEKDELLRLLGDGKDDHPVARLWKVPPVPGAGRAGFTLLSVWAEAVVSLSLNGHLAVEEAAGLLIPAGARSRRWHASHATGLKVMATNLLKALQPTLRLRPPPDLTPIAPSAESLHLRRELLKATVLAGGGPPFRVIQDGVPLTGDQQAELRDSTRDVMASLGFSAEDIGSALGSPMLADTSPDATADGPA